VSGRPLRILTCGAGPWTLTPDGRRIVSGLGVWELPTGQMVRSFQGPGAARAIAITADGKQFLAGNENHLTVCDLSSGRVLRTMEYGKCKILIVALTPDGKSAVTGALPGNLLSNSGVISCWDLDNGRMLNTLTNHTGPVYDIAVTPDGKQFVSASLDKTMMVWDLARGGHLRTLEGHTGTVWAVALTPDGKFAVSGSDDKTIRVWELARGKTKTVMVYNPTLKRSMMKTADLENENDQTLFVSDAGIHSLCLSTDLQWLICGDASGRVWVFEWVH